MTTTDNYEIVTNAIVEALEGSKLGKWKCPWDAGASGGLPVNMATGKTYKGINTLLLLIEQVRNGFTSNEWCTYKQCAKLEAEGDAKPHVRKGSKGSRITFFKSYDMWFDKAGNKVPKPTAAQKKKLKKKSTPVLRTYTVFNRDQIEGLPSRISEVQDDAKVMNRHETADAFIEGTGAEIRFGGSRACYIPSLDVIQLPEFEKFHAEEGFYSTAFHELGHWTGHEARLNREFGQRFGDNKYAFEELVAELCSAFLCAEFEFSSSLQHAEYIDNWIGILKADKYAVFTAAREAGLAASFLKGKDAAEQADETQAA